MELVHSLNFATRQKEFTMQEERKSKGSELLTDIVIGMSDGLTVPFALAAGLSGAVSNNTLITIAGIAEIAAGAIAMGLGGYLAGKTEEDHYNNELKIESAEIDNNIEAEKDKVRGIFDAWGFSKHLQDEAVIEISKEKKQWVNFMMKHEHGLIKPHPKRARKSAFNIGVSYIIGGMVPLSPYFFFTDSLLSLKVSVAVTLVCLYAFGFTKSKLTGVNPILGGLKVMLIGAIAAAAAFGIAKVIEG